jgi:hypothetical protein
VTETSKVVDVLLPLGRKQHFYVQRHMLCLHYTLCLMQLSVVRNLIFTGTSDDSPWVDYVTSQDFIKFWGKFFAFILYVLIENSQGFKTF